MVIKPAMLQPTLSLFQRQLTDVPDKATDIGGGRADSSRNSNCNDTYCVPESTEEVKSLSMILDTATDVILSKVPPVTEPSSPVLTD